MTYKGKGKKGGTGIGYAWQWDQYSGFEDLPPDDPSDTTSRAGPCYPFIRSDSIGTPGTVPTPALPTTVLPTTVQPTTASSNVGIQTVARAWWDMPDQPGITGELKHSPHGAFYWNNVTASWQYIPEHQWWWFPAAGASGEIMPPNFNPEESTAAVGCYGKGLPGASGEITPPPNLNPEDSTAGTRRQRRHGRAKGTGTGST